MHNNKIYTPMSPQLSDTDIPSVNSFISQSEDDQRIDNLLIFSSFLKEIKGSNKIFAVIRALCILVFC